MRTEEQQINAILARRPDLVLCSPFSRPETLTTLRETGLAVVQLGDPTDLAGLRANWQVDRTWSPQIAETEREAGYAGWKTPCRARCSTGAPRACGGS